MTEPDEQASAGESVRRTSAAWAVIAAFGTYFCMYAFRKPFTVETYSNTSLLGIEYKTILVTAQVGGYMLSKFIGIRVVAELPPSRRARMILVLIGLAELALLLFALIPTPWNFVCLFGNGLALGMIFGLVLGFLEGRQLTEFLTAGLCASFILADGVVKSLGATLVQLGVPVYWMPFTAGLCAAPLLVCFVWMLSRIQAPDRDDVIARSARSTMNRLDRRQLYSRFAAGLTVLVCVYLFTTIVRSIRADFAQEIWTGLGTETVPSIFTYSEFVISCGLMVVSGAMVLIRDNRRAFFASLLVCMAGFSLIVVALIGQKFDWLSPFAFMVLVGFGLYLPYVAFHTTIFERLLAMTREPGTIGFLMYVADAFGYLGYVAVMLSRHMVSSSGNLLDYFLQACLLAAVASLAGIVFAWRYFARHPSATGLQVASEAP